MPYADPEKRREYMKQRYRTNREHILEYGKRWREANPETIKSYGKQYRIDNRESMNEKRRQWYRANRERWRAIILASMYNWIEGDNYELMLARQGGHCADCLATASGNGKPLQVDHDHNTGVIRGIVCQRCNNRRSVEDRRAAGA